MKKSIYTPVFLCAALLLLLSTASLMSLLLSGITSLGGNFGLQETSTVATLASVWWMQSAWRLSNMVPTKAEAEAARKKENKKV